MYEVQYVDDAGKVDVREPPIKHDLELLRTWAKIQAWCAPAGMRVCVRRKGGETVIEYRSNGPDARPTELI